MPPFPAMSTVFQGTCVLRSRQGTGRLQKKKVIRKRRGSVS
ncbi:hypothetical protein HMPREF3038_00898 [Akkermansia sp. KLE1797]|nr:hypothetical protein HMPREF3038_00898 [Akkermansia sp. KLE1797]KXU54452.1 hypothetical protein HMPREF3039_01346 [Akkermansia sp. KLE1798]KZA04844.1 hypothetical protein HMPREF1326_01423 [Akkermansia sp. KLE1605]